MADWTDKTVARLRTLWSDGHSSAEIGRLMGISKNSVVGKVHRLGLSARPSPIRRGVAPRTPQIPRVQRTTLPALASVRVLAPIAPSRSIACAPRPTPRVPADPPRAVSVPPAIVYAVGGRGCQWPMWGKGERMLGREPLFCGQPRRDVECSYCAQHAAIGFVRVRNRRDDVADERAA